MIFTELIKAQLESNTINYSNTEAIYLNTPFAEESEVRFGQCHFEDGGVIDGKKFFCSNEALTDEIDTYLGGAEPEDCIASEMVDHLLETFGE